MKTWFITGVDRGPGPVPAEARRPEPFATVTRTTDSVMGEDA